MDAWGAKQTLPDVAKQMWSLLLGNDGGYHVLHSVVRIRRVMEQMDIKIKMKMKNVSSVVL